MNSRCTSQLPGGAGSSKSPEGFITSVTVSYSVAESTQPQYFYPLISSIFFFFADFWGHFLKGNFSDISKNIIEKSRKTKKS